MENNLEKWVKIDFVKWFGFPGEPLKQFEVSNLGNIRTVKNGSIYNLIPGTVRPGSSDRPEYKYFSLRILSKAFKVPFASCVLYAFGTEKDLSLFNITFIDGNHQNCCYDNLKFDLKKCKKPVSEETMTKYLDFAQNSRLYKIINYLLNIKAISYNVVFSREDITQDYIVYLFDNLWQFESRIFSSFETFCFYKAYDFISKLRQILEKSPQSYYLSFLTFMNEAQEDEGEKLWLENKAIMVSEFSIYMSRYSSKVIENGL